MKFLVTFTTLIFFIIHTTTVQSQNRSLQFEVEVEPVAYIFGGAGIHFATVGIGWSF